jgi:predicted lipoprotein with Yx(FWY)xxD motif
MTTHPPEKEQTAMRRTCVAAAALTIAIAIAACGGSNSPKTTGTTSGGSSSATVATAQVAGVGKVLVAGNGMALYTPNGESAKTMRCTGGCVAIWKPLAPTGGTPSGANGVGALTVVKRPDGSKQVAIAGHPLYTFVQDGADQVTGNGAMDAFGGQHFTWHVVLAGGTVASGSAGGSAQSSGGGSSSGSSGGGPGSY